MHGERDLTYQLIGVEVGNFGFYMSDLPLGFENLGKRVVWDPLHCFFVQINRCYQVQIGSNGGSLLLRKHSLHFLRLRRNALTGFGGGVFL